MIWEMNEKVYVKNIREDKRVVKDSVVFHRVRADFIHRGNTHFHEDIVFHEFKNEVRMLDEAEYRSVANKGYYKNDGSYFWPLAGKLKLQKNNGTLL